MAVRKPVLLIDDTENSRLAIEILESSDIELLSIILQNLKKTVVQSRQPRGHRHYLLLKAYSGILTVLKNILLLKKIILVVKLARVRTGSTTKQRLLKIGKS